MGDEDATGSRSRHRAGNWEPPATSASPPGEKRLKRHNQDENEAPAHSRRARLPCFIKA
jgi:hypothetical protein